MTPHPKYTIIYNPHVSFAKYQVLEHTPNGSGTIMSRIHSSYVNLKEALYGMSDVTKTTFVLAHSVEIADGCFPYLGDLMVRDDELNRLIRYAQGMGISVHFKPYIKGSKVGGGWTIDGSEINIYVSTNEPKINKVLYLIHELGHHKGFVENGRTIDPRVEEALNDEEEGRRNRKRIYLDEVNDTKYWEQIYHDTNCQFPIWKLYLERDFDKWSYEVYYETGKFPSKKEKQEKSQELREKYKK